MKKVILALLLLAFWNAGVQAQTKKAFHLEGEIRNYAGTYIYLLYGSPQDGILNIDSTTVNGGHFSLNGEIEQPMWAALAESRQVTNMAELITLFIEPREMKFSGAWDNKQEYALSGSAYNDDVLEVHRLKLPYYEILQTLPFDKKKEMSAEEWASLKAKSDSLQRLIDEVDMTFIRTRPTSFYSVLLLRKKEGVLPVAELEVLYQALPPEVQDTYDGRNIAAYIRTNKALVPGVMAPEVSGTEVDGQAFHIDSLRGRYVLLDFWASWCAPCRKSNPHLKAVYEKYHAKGLEIVCISSDLKADDWREAIQKDAIGMFHHLLNGQVFKENGLLDRSADISQKYNVKFLPTKFLIDPDGKLMGEVDDETLDKKLSEIFGF